MLALFGMANAHSHSHGDAGEAVLYKVSVSDRVKEIVHFLKTNVKELPDPFEISALPAGMQHVFADLGVAPTTEDTRFAFLQPFFTFSPVVNAVTAALHVGLFTNFLIRVSPDLNGWVLDLLVSFALGGIIGNVFLHLIPESFEMGDNGSGIITGFLLFCLLDKVLKSAGHEHSHSHGTEAATEVKATDPKAVSSTEAKNTGDAAETHAHPRASIVPALLNVAADFCHNITDGVALCAAFHRSTATGITAFIAMILHEVPHQFGDFALLVQGGASKAAGLQAQIVASSGTVLGVLLFHFLSSEENLELLLAVITPLTAGVFLYIGAVGILPEILECNQPTFELKVRQAALQAVGVLLGLYVMANVVD